ncbi:hypothetical protein DD237_008436 [Peronospora effusa]|uniref:Reverse transcriptase domain-containing protein n=1 Tax=Peronospora effusa TaxID=542832 RepID=A0A425C1H3_9STRA|nr:hypothetical protein DD237_008436 [Peronospora effusa]
MFEATRALFRRRLPSFSLHDSTGTYILSRQEAGIQIKKHFQDQFFDRPRTPVADEGVKRPLNNPITAFELECAFRRLRNGRATGPDSIPAELLKYGSELLAQPLADIINHGLATGDNIHLGDGILLELLKPNKPAGQCDLFGGATPHLPQGRTIFVPAPKRVQTLSRHCRCTADAVWAHRWIAARAQRYKERFHIFGIDLSRAFDTVNRDKLLSVLKPLLDDDEIRLIRLLLRKTMLSLRLGSRLFSPLESNTGTPQGDSLSPVLFVVYLEAALRYLAGQLDVPHDLLADMIVYADDADFICQSADIATLIETEAPAVLAKWSLQMKTSKTEHTIFSPRRRQRRLPSNLAAAALHRMWKVWLRPSKTSEATRLLLYNCYVLPILLYNCETWALTDSVLRSLESFHRQQLRKVIGVRYPATISNEKLYDRTKTQPLRFHLLRSRWSLLGHILRRPAGIPAYRFMEAFFNPSEAGK